MDVGQSNFCVFCQQMMCAGVPQIFIDFWNHGKCLGTTETHGRTKTQIGAYCLSVKSVDKGKGGALRFMRGLNRLLRPLHQRIRLPQNIFLGILGRISQRI